MDPLDSLERMTGRPPVAPGTHSAALPVTSGITWSINTYGSAEVRRGGGGRRARRDSYYHLQRTPPTCSLHCSRRRHTGLIVMHQGSYVRPPIHRQPNKACHHAVVHTISTSCHSWSPAAPPIPRGSPSPPAGGVKNATIATCEASCSAQTPHPHPHGAAQTGASQEAKAHVW